MFITYVGENNNSLYFVGGRKYEVVSKIEGNIYRVIDETGEDYLYNIDKTKYAWKDELDVPDESDFLQTECLANDFIDYDNIIGTYHWLSEHTFNDEVAVSMEFGQKKPRRQHDFLTRKELQVDFVMNNTLSFEHCDVYVIEAKTQVTGVVIIARGEQIKVVNHLIQKYQLENGKLTKVEDWKKMRGTVRARHKTNGTEKLFEIHWYECPTIGKVDFKIKTELYN